MSAFTFSALDASGQTQNGILEADSSRQVREQIRNKGWVPLSVGEQGQAVSNAVVKPLLSWRGKLNHSDLALLTRQLATLVQSGMPIEECLNTVALQAEKQATRSVLLVVRSKVLEGHSLADALRQQGNSFPATFSEMIAAGEHSGYLDTVLEQLADHLETSSDTRQKVKLALIYPTMLFSVAMLMVLGLLTYVVPQVVGVFSEQNAELPALTKSLISVSDFLQGNGGLLLLLAVAFLVFCRWLFSLDGPRLWRDRLLLNFRLTRGLTRSSSTSQFSNTLSILVASGIPLVESLKITREVLANRYLTQRLSAAIRSVEEGESLHKALTDCGQFSPMLLHMVASGEASGELGRMLSKAAEHEQRGLNYAIDGSMKLVEPLILLFIGGAIFTIVLAILQPIFALNQLI
ncbi:MAG: type II secretion system inner membrane protein GspF [Pseudomonadales bacterium]